MWWGAGGPIATRELTGKIRVDGVWYTPEELAASRPDVAGRVMQNVAASQAAKAAAAASGDSILSAPVGGMPTWAWIAIGIVGLAAVGGGAYWYWSR